VNAYGVLQSIPCISQPPECQPLLHMTDTTIKDLLAQNTSVIGDGTEIIEKVLQLSYDILITSVHLLCTFQQSNQVL